MALDDGEHTTGPVGQPVVDSASQASSRALLAEKIDAEVPRSSFWQRWGIALVRIGLIFAVFGAWWLVARLEIWPRYFVPTPSAVWHKFILTVTVRFSVQR